MSVKIANPGVSALRWIVHSAGQNTASWAGAFFFVALFAAAAIYAWEFDVIYSDVPVEGKQIELDEALALAGLLAASLAVFAGFFFRQRRDTARRIAAEQEARRLAMEDPLTGLPNRRQFEDNLRVAIAALPRAGASHGLLMLDLNGFKRINDVHGHPVGDELLSHIANRLRNVMRRGDMVARLGGDEFAVLAPHIAGPEAAGGVALRVIESLEQPIAIGHRQLKIGTAIGIALMPQDGTTVAEVQRKADIALYRAKADGGSRFRFFEPAMDASLRERDRVERELRAALASGDALRPFYQPEVDLKSGAVVGFEALARWRHPTLGDVPPARFIPIAEDCGLIAELTDHLLRQSCRDALQWPGRVVLSFNVSPMELRGDTLPGRVTPILRETGLPAERLELEITEAALVRDMEAAQALLVPLRETGVKIALDDFGTGYSSLYHLRNLKLDKIKIDRGFVEAMTRDPESAAIVRALVGLGTGLSLVVTAEGVGDSEQRSTLLADGCQLGQGFLLGGAMSAGEAAALIATAVR